MIARSGMAASRRSGGRIMAANHQREHHDLGPSGANMVALKLGSHGAARASATTSELDAIPSRKGSPCQDHHDPDPPIAAPHSGRREGAADRSRAETKHGADHRQDDRGQRDCARRPPPDAEATRFARHGRAGLGNDSSIPKHAKRQKAASVAACTGSSRESRFPVA